MSLPKTAQCFARVCCRSVAAQAAGGSEEESKDAVGGCILSLGPRIFNRFQGVKLLSIKERLLNSGIEKGFKIMRPSDFVCLKCSTFGMFGGFPILSSGCYCLRMEFD